MLAVLILTQIIEDGDLAVLFAIMLISVMLLAGCGFNEDEVKTKWKPI